MKIIILVLSMVMLASCGGARVKTVVGLPLVPESTHLEGVRQTVFVGEVMTSSAPLIITEVAILKNKTTATTSHRNSPRNLNADPGVYNLVLQNSEGKFYEASKNLFELNNKPVIGGLFLAKSETLKSSLYWSKTSPYVVPGVHLRIHLADLDEKPEVSISKSKQPPNNGHGFVSTLTYTGKAGGQIKFVYREFNNGLARAAFTQEISLDYVPEKVYSYKTARFLLHEASISDVEFTLLQSL